MQYFDENIHFFQNIAIIWQKSSFQPKNLINLKKICLFACIMQNIVWKNYSLTRYMMQCKWCILVGTNITNSNELVLWIKKSLDTASEHPFKFSFSKKFKKSLTYQIIWIFKNQRICEESFAQIIACHTFLSLRRILHFGTVLTLWRNL